MDGVDRSRPGFARRLGTRRAPVLPVLLVAASLVAACAGPTPSPSVNTPSPVVPATSATPTVTPAPSGPAEAWSQLDLPAVAEVARLEPTRAGAGGVATDTAFRLTSLDGRAPGALAARLVADPALSLKVTTVDGATAELRPATALRPGTLYRISLTRPDGSVEASWAEQAAAPLHVVATIPGNEATGVPVDTGIEITFDQFGVGTSDLARYLTITPATEGRFEASGRTIAFVPASPLATGRLYTVTIRHGLPLAGTGQILAADVVIRFETASTVQSDIHVSFGRSMVDASTGERAAFGLVVDTPKDASGNQEPAPATLPVTVHRLVSMDAAITAWRAISSAPDWTRATSTVPVATAGLPLTLTGALRLQPYLDAGYWIQLPGALPAGWYVVTLTWGGIGRQALLQVTDIATFALLAVDQSTIWVNDLKTTGPAAGATVSLSGTSLGRTDASGLLIAATPPAIIRDDTALPAMAVVAYGGRTAFLPVAVNRVCAKCDTGLTTGSDGWWWLLSTDRDLYRSTDTINAWGVVRNRDTGKVPASVTMSLVPDDGDPSVAPAIVEVTATPDGTGSFAVRLPLKALPAGVYRVRLAVGGTLVAERSVSVGPLVKPAYALQVAADKHAIISGASLTTSVRAAFFEGTPVAGTDLTITTDDQNGGTVRTNPAGDATARVNPALTDPDAQWGVMVVAAHPRLPEEAEIVGNTNVAVFRSGAVLDASGTVSGTQLIVTGRVSAVAFDRFEAAPVSDLWSVDPRGSGRSNVVVRLQITEHVAVQTQTGTSYDFILKQVHPVYKVTESTRDLGTKEVRTGADGSFRLALSVRGGADGYEIKATYTDEAGRGIATREWASDTLFAAPGSSVWLANADGTNNREFSVGDTMRLTLLGGAVKPPVARYLFAITQRGLRYATVGSGSTFRSPFTATFVPSVGITGVRFNGRGYETAVSGYTARLRSEDRRLTVQLTPDRARYAPGETASVSIRTLGADGKPVSASLFVRAVDEKLYAIGAAADSDPLPDLYGDVSTGIIGAVASHRTPLDDFGGGKGDTTGGGGGNRSDFRDWLVARLVTTGSDGRAQISVSLSDDLTSWRVTASGVDAALQAGIGTASLAVGLPFFVEATVAPEYLSVDHPVIRLRAFGSGLTAGETVRFSVSSDTLPMTASTVQATAFETAEITLPALTVGTHRLRITGSTGSGASLRTDALIRTFQVVDTRATQGRTTWAPLEGTMNVATGTDLTTITLVDAGRGRVVPVLQELASGSVPRADAAIAASLATRVLREQFGINEPSAVTAEELATFQHGDQGMAVIAYGSADLAMTALAAMAGDPGLDKVSLVSSLHQVYDDAAQTRDRRLLAMAGLAALGEPLLGDVHAAAGQPDLTTAERVALALAALYAGDETLARQLERDLLTQHGLRRGSWVRLDPGPQDDPAVQTARLAIVAASLGDPVAADMDAWLAENPPSTTLVSLERALAARGWARRTAGSDARAAVTVDGSRREVTVTPDQPVRLQLTPAQAAGARIEPVFGKVLVVTSWVAPLVASSLAPARGQAFARSVSPAGPVGSADTVIVTFQVTLGPDAGSSCWLVTDLVPSGLAPIVSQGSWDVDPAVAPTWLSPSRIVGQRVEFCVSLDSRNPVQALRYVARVVTPGTYRWEPAVLQSQVVPTEGIALPASTVMIAGIGG